MDVLEASPLDGDDLCIAALLKQFCLILLSTYVLFIVAFIFTGWKVTHVGI